MVKLQNPPMLQLELTALCNHDCVHCYNYWRKDFEKIADISKTKTEAEYLELARAIADMKPVAITLTGGEPLLVFDLIKSTIELLQENGIIVTINTNAVLLTEEICEYLKERNIHLFVSFPCAEPSICDYITQRPGSFDRIVRALDMVSAYGIDFATNMVVSKKNLDYVAMTIDFLKERYDANYISITRVGKPINSDDSFNEWLLNHDDMDRLLDISVAAMQRHKNLVIGTACPYTPCSINSQEAFDIYGYQKICTAAKTSFGIDTDGNMKACPRDSRLYGNILIDKFEDIYDRMHGWRDGSFTPTECKGCKELGRCLGGCRVDSIPLTGRSDVLDTISRTERLPIAFTKKPRSRDFDGKTFGLNPKAVKLEAEGYTRFSNGKRFVIITTKLRDFLEENAGGFNNKQLAEAFGVGLDTTNDVIGRLLSEGIISII